MSSFYQDIIETEIPVSQLAIGMHVVRLDRPWEETNFLLQGFVIRNEEDLLTVQSQCDSVTVQGRVDVYRKHTSARGANNRKNNQFASQLPERRVTYINKVDNARELETARLHYDSAKTTAKDLMDGIRLGRMLDMNKIRHVVDETVDSVLRNDNALLLLSKIKNKDEYTAQHCINVSILCAALGKHIGLLEGEIRKVALCGLLHDVGKMRVDDAILNKPGALTPEEFAVMKNHTTFGRDVLVAVPGLEHAAVDAALLHHERMDGSGYPRGIPSQKIPLFAKIVGLVDSYDAITSTRVYDKGRASMEALQIIHKNKGVQFDAELAVEFIKMIGIYPPGSIVEMVNGEVGIVVASTESSKLTPKVLMVRDADKKLLATYRQLDLSKRPKDSNGELLKIVREVPDGTYGIVLQEFIEEGILSYRSPNASPPIDDGHGEP